MSDSTSLQAEIDVLMEEMRDWEQGMAYEWSEADRCSFLEKKRDTIKNFFMNEVAAAERKSQNKSSGDSEAAFAKEQAQRQEEEAKLALAEAKAAEEAARQAEEAVRKAEEEAIEAEVRRQMEEEDSIRKRLAAEEAELEAEVRRQMEAEENARKQIEADEKAANEAAQRAEKEREEAAKRAAQEAAAREAAAKEAAAKEAAAKEAAAKEAAAKEAVKIASTPASPAVPLASPKLDPQALSDLETDLNAALEKELKEAQLRIARTPVGRQADLTDPSVIATYIRCRNDRDDLNWMILGYPSDTTPNKITVLGCGSGGWAEMLPQIPHDPIYIYINYRFGDTGRSKFVFMTYVPDNLSGMKKSRVLGHRPAVEKLLKYMQLSWHVLDYSEFSEETLQKKLLAIGGANYSVQESDKGDFSSYKKSTREFYTETEKKTAIGPVVYQTGPLTTTPMDISGRSMVAAPSDFRANIVDLK